MNSKRILVLVLALVMVLALAACGGKEPSAEPVEETTAPTAPATTPVEETPEETEAPAPAGLQYIVTVTDEGGNPIPNVLVQMCEGTNCVPAKTGDDGKAVFTVQAEADFEVKFMSLPAGYEYTTEEQVFHFDAGSKEMTLVLKAVA